MPVLLALTACSDPVEGTWLFRVERDPRTDGDCPDEPEDIDGYGNVLVDVYRTGEDGVVVLFEEALVGTFDGARIVADWEESTVVGTLVNTDELTLEADIDGGRMEGSVERDTREDDDRCTLSYDFEAERIISDAGAYAREG